MKSDEDKDNMRHAVGDLFTYLRPTPTTERERLADFCKIRDAVKALGYAHTAYCLHMLDESIEEAKALKPNREVLVEHFVMAATKFFNLHNGIFSEIYAVLRDSRTYDPALTRRLALEIETLAKHANGEQLAVLSTGITLLSREGEFFTEYRHMIMFLDDATRLELLAELKIAAGGPR